ncbi:MAG: rhodanese-like domain-containing protein [Opitutales bacterium]|nr:rhodanese-like domain-containing protein [Opitutales bacterium]
MFGLILFIILVLVMWVYLPRLGWVSVSDAREQLQVGALLLDVRSRAEYNSQPVKGAMNIPVDELIAAIQKEELSKDRTILLFCASGMRSGAARRTLRSYGYTQVENLGTVARAAEAVGGAGS